ncbi:hypothetical protein BaRGS_00017871 [Batillaria attramentaria]|uniref:Uncharacterized protein n=1 Tax=Batillaria attramentaria TaxID=370345 RepID=A0ABD0KUH2_9CAEN
MEGVKCHLRTSKAALLLTPTATKLQEIQLNPDLQTPGCLQYPIPVSSGYSVQLNHKSVSVSFWGVQLAWMLVQYLRERYNLPLLSTIYDILRCVTYQLIVQVRVELALAGFSVACVFPAGSGKGG